MINAFSNFSWNFQGIFCGFLDFRENFRSIQVRGENALPDIIVIFTNSFWHDLMTQNSAEKIL